MDSWFAVVIGGAAGILFAAIGWFSAMFSVSRDRRIVSVKEDEVIVKAEIFNKLVAIAQVKSKAANAGMKFDAKGHVKDPDGDDDE